MEDYTDPRNYLNNGIVKSEILNTKSTFIVCSYYWGHDNISKNSIKELTYGQYAERMIDDCKKLNINYNIENYPIFSEKKIYQTALALKGEYIMNCLNKFPNYKVIFLDVDLQILQYPDLFEIDADCFFINWNEYDFDCYNPYQIQLPGAILGFSNNFNSRTMLTILNQYMIKHLTYAEDRAYSGIISRNFMNTYLRCVWLPESYMFMFLNHEYNSKLGKYTKVLPLKDHLTDFNYKIKDIVMIHEDFETGALDDVYEKQVGNVDRSPPNEYKQKGEKLRCEKITFRNYIDYNLTWQQYLHFKVDFDDKQKNHIYKNVSLKSIPYHSNTSLVYHNLIKSTNDPIIISIIDKSVDKSVIHNFIKQCNLFNLDYLIFTSNKTVNKPVLFNLILGKYKRNIVYLDIFYNIKKDPKMFYVKNMDFMTFNLDNQNIIGPKCSDIRILKTLNDNMYFFAYNHVVIQFLQIWFEFNKTLKSQHKNLEYAFNISLSINKMRCYWIHKEYVVGPILNFHKNHLHSFFNNIYSKTFNKISDKLQRCGIAPSLDVDGEPRREHHFSSKNGVTFHDKYGKLFLQF